MHHWLITDSSPKDKPENRLEKVLRRYYQEVAFQEWVSVRRFESLLDVHVQPYVLRSVAEVPGIAFVATVPQSSLHCH